MFELDSTQENKCLAALDAAFLVSFHDTHCLDNLGHLNKSSYPFIRPFIGGNHQETGNGAHIAKSQSASFWQELKSDEMNLQLGRSWLSCGA